MREILFRGKRIDNGKWVYGCVNVMQNGNAYIFRYSQQFEVGPATVGQFTGLTDKNGKKIFEGDILFDGVQNYKVKYSLSSSGFEAFGKVESEIWSLYHLAHKGNQHREIEVIGNIYDNPELLGESHEHH